MPTIFAGTKKKNAQMVSPPEQESGDATLKALADSILNAIQSRDAANLAQALKSFNLECEEYEEE